MEAPRQARFLAPIALVAFAIAVVVIIATSGGGSTDRAEPQNTTEAPVGGPRPSHVRPRIYVVKPGDILSTIAEKTGVSVERIQALNPELDPQALVPGQRIKLRP